MNARTGELPWDLSGRTKSPKEMEGWWKARKQTEIDKDLVRAYYGDREAFDRVRAALATMPAPGEDGPCFYCGEQTCSVAGDPGRWPLVFCQPDGTGIARFHHTGCVTDRLFAATPAVGGEADDPFNRKQVEAVCRAVCGVEGVDPDSDVYGDGCDPQWSRYADAVAAALYAAPPASPLLDRDGIARIIDPAGMSDGIRRRWAFEKADAIIAAAAPPQ